MDISMIPAGMAGAVFTFAANWFVGYVRQRLSKNTTDSVLSKKFAVENRKSVTEQVQLILNASEAYREEIRSDMERMRIEFDTLYKSQQDQMAQMKSHYENEINSLRLKIVSLTEEVTKYRKENSELHEFMKEKNIQIPEWMTNK